MIVEDDKEINYSSSEYSTKRKFDNWKLQVSQSGKIGDDTAQTKEKSISKDLVEQMKEKIRNKKQKSIKHDNDIFSKIVVLGNTRHEDSWK